MSVAQEKVFIGSRTITSLWFADVGLRRFLYFFAY